MKLELNRIEKPYVFELENENVERSVKLIHQKTLEEKIRD